MRDQTICYFEAAPVTPAGAPRIERVEIVLAIADGGDTMIWACLALSTQHSAAVALERTVGHDCEGYGATFVECLPCSGGGAGVPAACKLLSTSCPTATTWHHIDISLERAKVRC